MSDTTEEQESAPLWVWIGLSLIACISFWLQALVTEERFVPALNIVAQYFNIPDDIAGATLMAAGASSPELFSSLTALFITHSSLGLGTIVGSEIFNQLIICAGAVFAVQTNGLRLDPAIIFREVGFYALSILLLFFALQDNRPDPDDESGVDHIYISFGEACYVFGGYVLYVIVCAKMDDIVAFCSGKKSVCQEDLRSNGASDEIVEYGAVGKSAGMLRMNMENVDQAHMQFLRETSLAHREPAANFERVELFLTKTGELHPRDKEGRAMAAVQSVRGSKITIDTSNVSDAQDRYRVQDSTVSVASAGTDYFSRYSDGKTLRQIDFLVSEVKPSDEHSLYDLELNESEGRLSCFLWQRSYFYDKARLAKRGWHLRWVSFYPDKISSVPDRRDADRRRMTYPMVDQVDVDEKRLMIRLVNPKKGKRNFYLMAPSKEILDAVVKKLDGMLALREATSPEALDSGDTSERAGDVSFAEMSLVEYPTGSSKLQQFFFITLFPFRFLMHWTVPDVQVFDSQGNPTSKVSTAFIAIGGCLLWLIVGSYAMVASLERLADLMGVPASVVGVTVSAAGTSLPNYVASKIAAEKGFGNMAVSNAFGSNTFNIMVGLGLPWLLYTSFGTGFQPYHGLRDEGIFESVEILGSVLAIFIVVVLCSGFVLYKWHAILFINLYIAYIAYEIARVYL